MKTLILKVLYLLKATIIFECVEKLVAPKVLRDYYNVPRLKTICKWVKGWVKACGKTMPLKYEICSIEQYRAQIEGTKEKVYSGQEAVKEEKKTNALFISTKMNDDVTIEAYEKNDSDKEIDDSLKINNEKNDPIDQISNESKEAMVNECVEKLVSPQVLAMNYIKKHNIRGRNNKKIKKIKNKIEMWVKLAGKSFPTKFEITTYDQYKKCYGPTFVLTPETLQPDDAATESRNSMISSIKESSFDMQKIDFDKVSSLDPNTELLPYIKVVAHGYKDAISSS